MTSFYKWSSVVLLSYLNQSRPGLHGSTKLRDEFLGPEIWKIIWNLKKIVTNLKKNCKFKTKTNTVEIWIKKIWIIDTSLQQTFTNGGLNTGLNLTRYWMTFKYRTIQRLDNLWPKKNTGLVWYQITTVQQIGATNHIAT